SSSGPNLWKYAGVSNWSLTRMNSVTHQSMPPTRVSTSRRMSSTNPSVGARAICMGKHYLKKNVRQFTGYRARPQDNTSLCGSEPAREGGLSVDTCVTDATLREQARSHRVRFTSPLQSGSPGHN